jgi:hypothetical protein
MATVTTNKLRNFLKEKLPDYMIPSAFVMMDSLPLTPNGKVDRKALPAPEPERTDMEKSFVSPRTPVEEALAGIWCEVLGLKEVGVHDNFFELGGHSPCNSACHAANVFMRYSQKSRESDYCSVGSPDCPESSRR